MSKVLGLDLGSNSVGWALIDTEAEHIIGMGVRIFPEAVNEKDTEREASKNVERRLKRQLRRQYERRRMRTNTVRNALYKSGLLPTDPDEFSRVLLLDPYELRARALNEKLDLFEIGRIVDHINSRRGFLSNRKASSEEEASGTIYKGTADGKAGINDVASALHPELQLYKQYLASKDAVLASLPPLSDGFRTMGEYLASLDPHEQRRRNRFTLRDHYRIELDLILNLQSKHYPKVLTSDAVDWILSKVFYQRPLKSVRHLVGKCRFEPGKKRSHKSHPEYQRFRFLQQLNSLRIQSADRVEEDETKLDAHERAALIAAVEQASKKIPFDKPSALKKVLGWPKSIDAKASHESIEVLSTQRQLFDALGRRYVEGLSRDELHGIWNILQFAEDVEWAATWAMKNLKVNEEQARAFAKIKLEDGYGNVSLRAARKILPFLEQGYMYHEAVGFAGYTFTDPNVQVDVTDQMPGLAPEDARNPTVQRSFAEMRKVVNAIVRKWGNPDVVRVEMGRSVKLPAKTRSELVKKNKSNRSQNEADRERLIKEFRVDSPRRSDILKLRLWEEQGYVCMYTGKQISKNMLFDGSADVDHILPYSRTLDDGRNNKVVCLREINLRKSDLTPIEAANRGIFAMVSFRERVNALFKNHKITVAKQHNLLMSEDVFAERFSSDEETGFVARQLNDTRFVSRLATKYLHNISPKVESCTGMLTAMLRRHWGLDGVLPELASLNRAWVSPITEGGRKDRDDHRHHAVDALTIALTTRSVVQKVATLNARSESSRDTYASGRLSLPDAPFAGLRKMAIDAVDAIIVSHRKTRRGRGALHAETLYGIARGRNGEQAHNEKGVPLYVTRKPISAGLSSGQIQNIVDPVVRGLVLDRLRERGVDVDADKFTVPKDAFMQPIYRTLGNGKRQHVKRVRVYIPSNAMTQLRSDGVYVEPDANDHIRIIRSPEYKKPLWEVVRLINVATNAPSSIEPSSKGEEMILRIGDLLEHETAGILKVQKLSMDGRVWLYHHADAAGNVERLMSLTAFKLPTEKLTVSVIGDRLE